MRITLQDIFELIPLITIKLVQAGSSARLIATRVRQHVSSTLTVTYYKYYRILFNLYLKRKKRHSKEEKLKASSKVQVQDSTCVQEPIHQPGGTNMKEEFVFV